MEVVWQKSLLGYVRHPVKHSSSCLQLLEFLSLTEVGPVGYPPIHSHTLQLKTICDKGHIFTEWTMGLSKKIIIKEIHWASRVVDTLSFSYPPIFVRFTDSLMHIINYFCSVF